MKNLTAMILYGQRMEQGAAGVLVHDEAKINQALDG